MNEWQYECLVSTLILQAADPIYSAEPGLANIRLSLDVFCRVQCNVLGQCNGKFAMCSVKCEVYIVYSEQSEVCCVLYAVQTLVSEVARMHSVKNAAQLKHG